MARDLLTICNEALGGLPSGMIESLDDDSNNARQCSLYINGVITDLIGVHDWTFVNRRVALAEIANDRSGEWLHAYSLPTDADSPIQIIPNYRSSASALGLVVTPVWYWPGRAVSLQEALHSQIPYHVSAGVLYTDMGEAILEYSADAIEPATWPSLFSQAVIRTLEERIYKPILGAESSDQVRFAKGQVAQLAVREAIADDMNRQPRRAQEFVSEAVIARGVDIGGCWSWPR